VNTNGISARGVFDETVREIAIRSRQLALMVCETPPKDIKAWARALGAHGMLTLTLNLYPEFAAAVLATAPPNPRGKQFAPLSAERYKRDMEAGRFEINHQGAAFDVNGDFFDAYNRFHAVVESQVPIEIRVTFGCPLAGKREVDGGTKRPLGAAIGCSKRVASLARLFREMPCAQAKKKTNSESENVVIAHKEGLEFSADLCGSIRVAIGVLVARAYYHLRHDAQKLDRLRAFCEILRNLQGKTEDLAERDQAAGQLRAKLRSRSMTKATGSAADEEVYCFGQTALEHFLDGRPIGQFRQTTTDLYPVLPEQE